EQLARARARDHERRIVWRDVRQRDAGARQTGAEPVLVVPLAGAGAEEPKAVLGEPRHRQLAEHAALPGQDVGERDTARARPSAGPCRAAPQRTARSWPGARPAAPRTESRWRIRAGRARPPWRRRRAASRSR